MSRESTTQQTRRRRRPLVALGIVALTMLAGASPAAAHDTTDGSTVVEIGDRRVTVTGSVPFGDLGYTDTSGDGLIDADELAAQEADVAPTLVATVRDHAAVTVDGEPVEIIGAGVPSPSEFGGDGDGASPYAMIVFATGPHDGDVDAVSLEWGFETAGTRVIVADAERTVTAELGDDDTIAVSLGTWTSARSFFDLGVQHIRFGPDHLLFLLVLTLAVVGTTVTGETAWRSVELVTAFTAGHALSLALAYFDVISIPAWIVEPAISLSIVVAAVLAIRGRANEARPWIASLIGVVHGLGFASSLGTLGVATSQQVVALAAFNVGIDVAQTFFVLLVIGGIWLAGQLLAHRVVWARAAVAASAAAFGVAWTVSRLAELPIVSGRP